MNMLEEAATKIKEIVNKTDTTEYFIALRSPRRETFFAAKGDLTKVLGMMRQGEAWVLEEGEEE